MISLFDNCLFVHIPKVAGQSVEQLFLDRAGLSWQQRHKFLLTDNNNCELGPPRLAHLTAQEYLQLGYVKEPEFNQLFKFSFVRNPWERLVSEYRYRQSLGFSQCQKSFKYYVMNAFPKPSDDNYVEAKDLYRHVIPQYQFLYNDDDELLVDFVGRFENLQEDFGKVAASIGISENRLVHKNRTIAKKGILSRLKNGFVFFNKERNFSHYSHYYDGEIKDFVAKYYAKDIKLFGYKFEQR